MMQQIYSSSKLKVTPGEKATRHDLSPVDFPSPGEYFQHNQQIYSSGELKVTR